MDQVHTLLQVNSTMLDVQMFISEVDMTAKRLAAVTQNLITEMKEVRETLYNPDCLMQQIEPIIKKFISANKAVASVLQPKQNQNKLDDIEEGVDEVKLNVII